MLSNNFVSSNPIFFELSQQAVFLQSEFQSRLTSREQILQTKLDSLLSNLDSKISSIKTYHKSLLLYEKELQHLCFSTIDDFEAKIKDLDSLINSETNNLLANLTQNFAISISNAYCSLLQELKDSFSNQSSIENFEFSSLRHHFSTMFETFEIKIPKEFMESANSLELEVNASFKEALNGLVLNKDSFVKNLTTNLSSFSSKKNEFESEDDDIDKRMKSLDKKIEAGTQSFKSNKKDPSDYQESPHVRSQGEESSNKKSNSFFSKMKSIFSKKKGTDLDDLASGATEMKLGDESKFRYDPMKKKYIFEGEEEEPEEIIPPPMIIGTSSRSAHIEKNRIDQEKDNNLNNQRDYLMKPPARSYIHKKKEEPNKKNLEKFTIFNPNENAYKIEEGEIQANKDNEGNKTNLKKRRYSEGISLHFEKIVRNMKEKINDFLEKRLKKNEVFYSELDFIHNIKKIDPFKLLEEEIKPCFDSKIKEFNNFQRRIMSKNEENKENLLRNLRQKDHSDEQIEELALKLTAKSWENLKLEGSIIELQSKCFNILRDNLWILMNSRKEGFIEKDPIEKPEYSLKYEEIVRFSQENHEELMEFIERNIEENRSFYIGIIEQLMERLSIGFNEKKTLYEGFNGILRIQANSEEKIKDLYREIEEIHEFMDNKEAKIEEKNKEILDLKKKIEEIRRISEEKAQKSIESEIFLKGKIEESTLKKQELKEKLDFVTQKIEDLSKELLENQGNMENLMKNEDLSRLFAILQIESLEIQNISNFLSKFKYLFSRLSQKTEEFLNEKDLKIRLFSNELERTGEANSREKDYFLSEISMKDSQISLIQAKIQVIAKQLEEKVLENEKLRTISEKTSLEKQSIISDYETNEAKNLELLKENVNLEAKIKDLSNENLRISSESSHLKQIIAKFDSETAEKFSNFRKTFSQLDSENQALKSDLETLRNQGLLSEKKLKENQAEIADLKLRNQEISNKIREIIRNRDLKFLELETAVSQLKEEKGSLEDSQTSVQGEYEKLKEELEKIQREKRLFAQNEQINQENNRQFKREIEELHRENNILLLKNNENIKNLELFERKMNDLQEKNENLVEELAQEKENSSINQRNFENTHIELRNLENKLKDLENIEKALEKTQKELINLRNIGSEEKNELRHQILEKNQEIERIQEDYRNYENSYEEMKRNEEDLLNKIKTFELNITDFQNKEKKFNEFSEKLKISNENEELLLQEKVRLSQEINLSKQEFEVLKAETHKYQELIEKLKEENENLRIKLLKNQGNEEILRENLDKINEFREENEKLFMENEDLKVKMVFYIENEKKDLENNINNTTKSLKEMKRENERLKEEIERNLSENSRVSKVEIETLQRVLEKKSKAIEKLENNEKEMGKTIENLKKLEGKCKDLEEFNNSLLREKKKLLEENDNLYGQLNKKDFYEETMNLKQKVKNIEEEKTLLKISNAESLDKLNGELAKYKEIIDNLMKKEADLDNNQKDNKGNNENINKESEKNENLVINKEEERNNPGMALKAVEGGKSGGFMYGIASFFLTEKEMKIVKK